MPSVPSIRGLEGTVIGYVCLKCYIMRSILRFFVAAVVFAAGVAASAQDSPVQFMVSKENTAPGIVQVKFEAAIADGWHVYSTGMPDGGPVSAAVVTTSSKGVGMDGEMKAEGKEISTYENMFGMDVRYYEHKVVFIQNFKIKGKGKKFSAEGYLEFGACNDTMCLPPSKVEFSFDQTVLSDK